MLIRRELPTMPVPAIRNLLKWDPFREMAPFFETEPEAELRLVPFDVKETKDAYIFKADLPGMIEKEVEVSLTGSRLTVSGRREEEKKEKGDVYYTWERSCGAFTRSFTLPEGIAPEQVEAQLKDGVLTVVVPKKPELKPQKISIKGLLERVKA